jgi:DNA topoisomerase I
VPEVFAMPGASIVVRVRKTTVTRVTVKKVTVRKVTVETAFRFPARVCHSCDAEPGVAREKVRGTFRYRDSRGRVVTDPAVLARVKALAIPPAWKRVWVCASARGHVQATGWDARGRKQYRYHPAFRARQDGEKFARLAAFGRALPRLRARVAADLARPGLTRDKALAAVVRLLDRTHLRVGNPEYVRSNNSFGLSTLLDRHVSFPAGGVRVRFRGKSGVRHDRTISDRKLAAVVRRCRDVPGQLLFQYEDEKGRPRPVGSADVNGYIRRAAGGPFTAKDFRTWAGTVSAAARLAGERLPHSDKAAERVVARVVREVAAALGNTPAVCRKSYVHPRVVEAFAAGEMHRGRSGRRLSKDEDRVLRLLSR